MRKTLLIYLLAAVFFVAAADTFTWRVSAGEKAQTWTGFVTDTHCGTNCQVTKNMTPDLHCIKMCVKRGSKYGLWSGNKVYVLDPQSEAAKYAAKKVKVTGTMTGDTIHATSIVPVEPSAAVKRQ
ncbi:MAG TPA: hypothetical protein VGR72_10475 [Candidatus Acidoferrales bacterium]|nr:hypothetical protein [Candidatus Acidoferrales bacterium]